MSLRKAAQLGGKDAKLKADTVTETPQQRDLYAAASVILAQLASQSSDTNSTDSN